MALSFDTHQYVKKLKGAGVPEAIAEIQAEALTEIIDEKLATKLDIELVRRDMKEMELRLAKDISDTKAELLKWMAGMLIAQAAVVAALVKLLQ